MALNRLNFNDTNPAAPSTGTTDDGVNVHYQAVTPDPDSTVNRDTSSYIKPLDLLLAARADKTLASYTILNTDFRKQLVFHDVSPVAPVAVTVPQAGTTGFPAKYYALILNLTTTTVTLTPTTSTINGASSFVISANGGCLLASDGTNWLAFPFGGGFTNPMTTLGDIIYEDVSLSAVRLAGNITTARKFLRQVGTGSVSAAPAWDTVTATDVGLANVTNDAQTKASVVPNTAPSNGQVPIGNGSAYVPATLTAGANVTISNASGSITIAAIAGGGAGVIPQPPALAGFTWVNQGSSTASQNGGAATPILVAIPRTAALNWRLLTMSQPSTPYHLSVVFKSGLINSNSSTAGIYFRDSVGGKMIGLEMLAQAGVATVRVQRITNTTTDGSTVFSSALYSSPMSFAFTPSASAIWRIRNDATKLYFDWSFDGYNWSNWYNENVGTWLTPDSVGIGGVCATSSASDFTIIGFSGWDLSAGATL
jgi:hypothetical protein